MRFPGYFLSFSFLVSSDVMLHFQDRFRLVILKLELPRFRNTHSDSLFAFK